MNNYIDLNMLLFKLDKYNNYDLISISKLKEIIMECEHNTENNSVSILKQNFTKLP